jgi:hypothetical protein
MKGPMMKALAVTLLLLLATAVDLAGCGGGGSSDPVAQASTVANVSVVTKAELIKKGDAICRHTDIVQKERIAAYEKKHPGVTLVGPTAETVLRKVAFPPIAVEIEKVAVLGFPNGDEKQLKEILSGWKTALKETNQKPALVMGVGEGPFTRPDELAAKYGFKDCAKAL